MTRIWLLIALLMPVLAQASSGRVGVAVLAPSESFRERFESSLEEALVGRIEVTSPEKASLLLAIGSDAFQEALDSGKPAIGLMVPRRQALGVYANGCGCTAFFAETDPRLQLELLQRLFPGVRRVALLTGPDSLWVSGYLQPHVSGLGLLLEHHHLDELPSTNALGRQLSRLLPAADVLLAIDEPALYSAETARLVLLTSYRQDKPVVGPDERFVGAGSVASVYYSGQDMVNQAARAVSNYLSSGRFPSPDYPRHFSVAVNEHVARTYDAASVDGAELLDALGGGR